MPVLDDPLTNDELQFVIKSMNENISYSGLYPGVIGILPLEWIYFFLIIFIVVFLYAWYPVSWCYNIFFSYISLVSGRVVKIIGVLVSWTQWQKKN